jgi:topoisomerase IA-like protein
MYTSKQLAKMPREAVEKLHSLLNTALDQYETRAAELKAIRASISAAVQKQGLTLADIQDLFIKRRGPKKGSKKAKTTAKKSGAKKVATKKVSAKAPAKVSKKVAKKVVAKKLLTPKQRSEAMKAAWERRREAKSLESAA